jgi:hypothetical protein
VARMEGEAHRSGLLKCRDCAKQFSVTVGTVMERSHIPLAKWVLAFHLMAASKKGMSAHQLHRSLNVTYKTAWFMAHRIREAMRDPDPSPLGGRSVPPTDWSDRSARRLSPMRDLRAAPTFPAGPRPARRLPRGRIDGMT